MEKDLKSQNVASLTAIYFGTFILLGLVHWSIEEVFAVTEQLAQQTCVVAAITGFSGMLSNFSPNTIKHSLVFLRFHNVLPGHRCKEICTGDPRLSAKDLKIKWPKLFAQDMDESMQNGYWYREIYAPVRNAPEVLQAHRSFLLYRDASSGLFILLVGLLVWRFIAVHVSLASLSVWSLVLLTGIMLVLGQAGRQSGNRMVANAVAVGLTRPNEPGTKAP